MNRILFLILLLAPILFAQNLLGKLQKDGLIIVDKNNNKIHIKRELSPICTEDIIRPNVLFRGAFSERQIPQICKKTFVTKVGILQPIKLLKGLETVGELEVLLHIKNAQENVDNYILIDARTAHWFKNIKIPTAVNLPFNEITYSVDIEEDDFDTKLEYKIYLKQTEKLFNLLNIRQVNGSLDFSKVKSVMLYCNGSWCSQSANAIFKLINIGYPVEKILWYRGGLQDWLIYDYTVIKDKS